MAPHIFQDFSHFFFSTPSLIITFLLLSLSTFPAFSAAPLQATAACVVQAATDILEVSSEAIETEVTSEVEETLLATQHTYRDRGSILQ